MRTAQELVDVMCAHLEKQNCAARDSAPGSFCSYIMNDGKRCAVGALMTEDECRSVEGRGDVEALFQLNLLPDELEPYVAMLQAAQFAHDSSFFNADGAELSRRVREACAPYLKQ